ncbi:AAA family ATPase [Granulicella arctica]|uniref:AAA family ATPase n=1 Tax=Granulicella arctica TaxID=940613 RepID=UPI0021DFD00C|nr:AAA family ATPase [Granulicella arctica]
MRIANRSVEGPIANDPKLVAIFCVCTSQDFISAVASVSVLTPGFIFAGAFQDYVTADKRPQFPQSMKGASSCIALVDFDRDPELASETVKKLGQIFYKRICMIAVGSELTSTVLLRAVRAGCMEYLTKPLVIADFTASLVRFKSSMMSNIQVQSSTGRVLAFFGAKGGVGTTTLAVHLASHLVQQHHRKTLIIDHKHQLGHVALYLGLKDTQYHFDELLRNVDRLDVDLLNGYAIQHSSGLVVIASPDISTKYYECKQDEIERVMEFLRSEYDFILIDSSVEYEDTKMSIIEQADDVYLISTPDVASLRDLARLVEHISLSPSADGKLSIVINRSTANDSITADQIKKVIRFPVSNTVPNNYIELLRSINQGCPVSPARQSEFNLAIKKWVSEITGERGIDTSEVTPKPKPKKRLSLWNWKLVGDDHA